MTRTAATPIDVESILAGPTLPGVTPLAASPVRVNPLSAGDGSRAPATAQRTSKDSTSPQLAQRRLIGYIAGSLGLAGIGLGATTSMLALSKKDPPPDKQCADPVRMCSLELKSASGHSSLSTLGAAGWAIGAVGIATGAALILTSNPKTGQETALGTNIYRRGAGLSVQRTW